MPTILTGQNLGGMTLTPGVYCFANAAQLTGTLTLNGAGLSPAVFVFKIGSTLTTASASAVQLTNGADSCSVFWQVGSSATLGAGTTFAGNVLARASISMNAGASLDGRAVALTGAVTLIGDSVVMPCCATWNNYGVGWPGTAGIPRLTLSALPRLGTTPNLVVQNTYVVPTYGLLLWGSGATSLPTLFGGNLQVQPILSSGIHLALGQQAVPFAIPLNSQLHCLAFDLQFLVYDKGASHFVAFTRGLHVVLGS